MRVLVTGGAGYIGSHTVVELLLSGHQVIVVDSLRNSSREALKRVESITYKPVRLYESDIGDADALERLLEAEPCDAVIHFAASKAVGESVADPLAYYRNNVSGTVALLEAMRRAGVRRLVYSSSACVYGAPEKNPVAEDAPLRPENPYGRTKVMIESILSDMAASQGGWSLTSLRYFNPIGAHESGLIGDDPNGVPNNLLPYIEQVAVGKRPRLNIYGDDYRTRDGTCVRDYIHVSDLALAHVAALEHLEHPDVYKAYNIGTGRGSSVLEVHDAYQRASGKEIPYVVAPRRPGDVDEYYGDPSLAFYELGWKAERSIERGCIDSWRWKSKNPEGYAPAALHAHTYMS
jgi:UDP-glucose 4-epimerase